MVWCDWNVFESIVNSQGRGKDRGRAGVIRAGLGFEDRMLVCYLRLEYGLYRTVLYCAGMYCTVLYCATPQYRPLQLGPTLFYPAVGVV